MFDYSQDNCERLDIPDAAASAFRDAKGNIQLIAGHSVSYRMVGADFNRLQQDCGNGPVLSSHKNWDPKAYDDQEWLQSLYTEDGQNIYALIHMEYEGHRYAHPDESPVCDDGDPLTCQLSSITQGRSTDMGKTYTHTQPPDHLVATLPYAYDGTGVGIYGIFAPSNILKSPKDGYYYALIRAFGNQQIGVNKFGQRVFGYRDQRRGACIMRTPSISNPQWRAWDGMGFNVTFINPNRTETEFNPKEHVCQPLVGDNGSIEYTPPTRGLFWSTYLNKFVGIGEQIRFDQEQQRNIRGAYYAFSENLTDWSEPQLLRETSDTYNTLIDHNSPSINFDTVGKTAHLYFTRKNAGIDRDLLRVPVEFVKDEPRGRIVGRIVRDDNGNGKKDPGERFIKAPSGPKDCTNEHTADGFTVSWSGPDSAETQTVADRCNNGGPFYNTGDLPQGIYTLSLKVPEGWETPSPSSTRIAVTEDEVSHQWFFVKRSSPEPILPRCDLSVSPAQIIAGQSATLSWTSQNADDLRIDQSIGVVALSGSRTVSPQKTLTYTATATTLGQSAKCSATLTVKSPSVDTGRILGRIVKDDNGNGRKDAGETFIKDPNGPEGPGGPVSCANETVQSNVIITWSGRQDGSTIPNQCNDGGPFYDTGDIPDGTYDIDVTPPNGWVLTRDTSGTINLAANTVEHRWFFVRQESTVPPPVPLETEDEEPRDVPAIRSQSPLIRATGDMRIYYITGRGLKRWIPTPEIFLSYGNRWEDVIEVSQAELDAIPINTLIRREGGTRVYLLENNTKRWITTADAFVRNGFDWSEIAPVNRTELDFYETGRDLE